MRGKLNNQIVKYEAERDRIKVRPTHLIHRKEMDRLPIIEEVLKVLYSLRG